MQGRYEYFDPPDRTQGFAITKNGTFPGVLGLVWRREVEFFLGDVTITYERNRVVEFSFLTLADSGAFVTKAPGRLNEALALVRPFQWQVWPPIITTLLLSGPIMFMVMEAPSLWRPRKRHALPRWDLFWSCIWFNTTIFLRQTGREVSKSHKVRLLTVLLSFAATYVIGDMYSANLTSLLAKPGRESPISTLEQLEFAMKTQGYQLLVEIHSSSYGILENGTEVYQKLWRQMARQPYFLIESVEAGMQHVRDSKNFALLGGRETLYFDTRRFGSNYYHLSEKLYTRYSAIAMQIGCPFLENFNQILMQLFEAGILTKMTAEEYEKLGGELRTDKVKGDNKEKTNSDQADDAVAGQQVTTGEKTKTMSTAHLLADDKKLQPISMTMLQGAFIVLALGYSISVVAFSSEMLMKILEVHEVKCKMTKPKVNMTAFQNVWVWCEAVYSRLTPLSSEDGSCMTLDYIE
uniref:Ionotropic glutamate receptor C-terminal domain-containing protein n=1 Tax=Timema cristinae TaxID=61476 RepID=A0A7R9CBK7_TIMCR|nr:unnamed protein product [Timema cristinae]